MEVSAGPRGMRSLACQAKEWSVGALLLWKGQQGSGWGEGSEAGGVEVVRLLPTNGGHYFSLATLSFLQKKLCAELTFNILAPSQRGGRAIPIQSHRHMGGNVPWGLELAHCGRLSPHLRPRRLINT